MFMRVFWQNFTIISSVKDLQENFILTYIDKTNTNYAIVFKQLYGDILKETYSNERNCQLLKSTSKQVIGNRMNALYKKYIISAKK